ncbi:unnamed protein product, partial [Mesorhabditis belari]|uniref:Uncharacterized protein n=1 Tax=Mesorhabditis belari TaxID=2138241 RepID=A0AAF3ELS5_9BILA
MVYSKDTYKGMAPNFCQDQLPNLVQTVESINLISTPFDVISMSKYDDPPFAFFNHTQLFTFQHYYLPYNFRVSKSTTHRMWQEMKEIELPKTPNHDRKELVKTLWKMLCK